jgi:hypothetical protein
MLILTLQIIAWVIMSALVAGVVEETAFRGYVQAALSATTVRCWPSS